MENTRIKCTIDDISKMKNIFEENSNKILECLKLIDKDYEEMPNILNTPNSNKIIPRFQEYVKEQEKYMNQNVIYYTKVFDTIINEYNEFFVDTKEKVGGEK